MGGKRAKIEDGEEMPESKAPVNRQGKVFTTCRLFKTAYKDKYWTISTCRGQLAPGFRVERSRHLYLRLGREKHRMRASEWLLCTFIGLPPSPSHCVEYMDGNPSNLSLENLRWVDRHVAREPTIYVSRGAIHHCKVIGKKGEHEMEFSSVLEAAAYSGCTPGNVCRSARECKETLGWQFRYKYIESIEGEVWAVLGGKREVSNMGRIRKPVPGGYVELNKGRTNKVTVGGEEIEFGLLMAKTFMHYDERGDPTLQVRHKNGDESDFRVENLELVPSGKQPKPPKQVTLLHRETGNTLTFESAKAAGAFLEISTRAVTNCISKKLSHPHYDISYN